MNLTCGCQCRVETRTFPLSCEDTVVWNIYLKAENAVGAGTRKTSIHCRKAQGDRCVWMFSLHIYLPLTSFSPLAQQRALCLQSVLTIWKLDDKSKRKQKPWTRCDKWVKRCHSDSFFFFLSLFLRNGIAGGGKHKISLIKNTRIIQQHWGFKPAALCWNDPESATKLLLLRNT